MTASLLLAALLPVIPQPTSFTPSDGVCNFDTAKVRLLNDPGTLASRAFADNPSEAYTIAFTKDAIEIKADGPLGLVWADRTLKQLKAAGPATPCGILVDKPKYRVRGFVMDVGRMYHSMDFLRDLANTMSYYKMNTLHIHLNDNEIEKNPNADWSKKQAAFRLESETYPGLTAKDGSYTKREFREFMLYCRGIGVTVVPEIDVPAHSLAFTRFKPEFASKKYGEDHFDLDKTDEIVEWLKPLFAEYMTGGEPTFIGPYVHVGTDEYNKKEAEKFRYFTDKMLKMVRGFGYKPCAWGALTHAKGTTPVLADKDVTMDIWHNPYYQPAEALEAGYSIVSVPDGLVYLVPFAGYYYDYLDCRSLFNNWEPNRIGGYTVPEDRLDQLAGGKFALWNDMLGRKKDGSPYSEADNWDRIYPAMQTLSQKFWTGKAGGQDWEAFAKLADSLGEPKGVKNSRTHRLSR